MMYEITVRKTITTRKPTKEWVALQRLENGKTEYGYAPETDIPTTETVEVYSQKFDDLDLEAVIIAANRLLGVVIQRG
ncbi:MAG TPA: hypothetical protein VIY48_07015 [Candidatus Paceibacterota bacterium]